MSPDLWVTLILGVFGGGSVVKGMDLILSRADGTTERRRAETDRLYSIIRDERARADAAETAEDRRAKRERLALEALSATRRVAIDHGVPLTALPPVNLEGH